MYTKTRIILISLLLIFLGSLKNIAQTPVKLAIGASVGGSGLAGIPVQLRLAEFMAIDLGIYFRTVHADVFEDKWFFGPAADIGLDFFFSHKENIDKSRITEHGIYLKGAYGLHKRENNDFLRLQERMAGIGWLMEISDKIHPNRKLQFQLGPTIIQKHESYLNTRYPPGYQLQNEDYYTGMIYGRICWFFNLGR